MDKRRRQRIFRNILPISKLIPSVLTIASLLVGLTQIKFALSAKWEYVVLAVFISALLDGSDGRLARLLNACSRFGAELDSLADFAAFGLAPAISLYLFSLHGMNRLGWIAAIFFAMCMCLRLARFNTNDIENVKTPLSDKYFTGVPAPAGAIMAEFPIILYNAFGLEIFVNRYFCFVNIVLTGLLCISKTPTISIKKVKIKRENYRLFLLFIVLISGLIFVYTWVALAALVFAYIISIAITRSAAKKLSSPDISG